MCRNCGKLAQNLNTQNPYSLYVKNKNEFYYIDKVSGEILPAFDTCQFCGSWKLQTLGIGTERIQKELKKLFPERESVIIDSEHAKSESHIKKVLKIKSENKGRIIIGTQLALPYLSNIDTSFVVSIDGIFYQQSYTNEERLLFLIKKIFDFSRMTYVQTKNIKNRKIKTLQKENVNNNDVDKLKLKFSKKINQIVEKIKYTNEFAKVFSSRYSESLSVWNIIKNGNYRDFLNKKETDKTVIKIEHTVLESDYKNLFLYYQNSLQNYKTNIKTKRNKKRKFIDIVIIIFIEKEKWNIWKQDNYILSKIPYMNRMIKIEINPENF